MEKEKKERKKITNFSRYLIAKEVDQFLENLTSLLFAGVPIREALISLEDDFRSLQMKQVIAWVREAVDSGFSLSQALEMTGAFPERVCNLIRMGEKSGKLTDNLEIVSQQEEKRRLLASRLKSALAYPVFTLTLSLFIGIGLAWFVLPRLAAVFSQLNIELPFLTRALISIGSFLEQYGVVVVPLGVFSIIILVYTLFYGKKTKVMGEHILFVIPGLKDLLVQTEIVRFGYFLGTFFSATIPPDKAMYFLEATTPFVRYRKFYRHLGDSIAEGKSFKEGFQSYHKKVFPNTLVIIISASERAGSLGETLIKTSRRYEAKTEESVKRITVLLEPVMLVVVALMVISVALAVILPIYNLMGEIGNV